MSDTQELSLVEKPEALTVRRAPNDVLIEAQRAAVALQEVILKKEKPVIINGQQYLEFEDWSLLGRFYGVTAKVVSSQPITIPVSDTETIKGYEARAVAIRVDTGEEISAADAMCTDDEERWGNRPLFQLRSMAQTRACSKALRNVLSWVVVLAGYKGTPAEEMTGQDEPAHASATPVQHVISAKQASLVFAKWCNEAKLEAKQLNPWLLSQFQVKDYKSIPAELLDDVLTQIKQGNAAHWIANFAPRPA